MWRENAGSHPPGKERDACLTPADGYANVAALIEATELGNASAKGELPADTKFRSSKYLHNLIEQDHRGVKLHIGPMLGLERFRTAAIVIAGIELLRRIRKGQFNLARLRLKDKPAPAVWDAVLAA
jgi:hypothetical protein